MDGTQRVEIAFLIFADEHFSGAGYSLCSDNLCKLRQPKTEQAEACSTKTILPRPKPELAKACTTKERRQECHFEAQGKPALHNRLAGDAQAGVDAGTVAAARDAVRQDAASAGGQRRGSRRATAGDGNRRRTKRNRRGRQRAGVFRVSAPRSRPLSKLDGES